jgi:hypothetical protein
LIIDREARHLFSFGTCNGCHAGETATVFTHVKPETPIGRAAALSGFMTGNPGSPDKALHVPDPGNPGAEHRFNDLERRQVDLATLVMDLTPVDQRGVVSASFVNEVRRQPLRMVH